MNKEESSLFTAKQGQYLAFIYYYTKVNGVAPAESDFERIHFLTAHNTGRVSYIKTRK